MYGYVLFLDFFGAVKDGLSCPLARKVESRTGFSISPAACPKPEGSAECAGAGLTCSSLLIMLAKSLKASLVIGVLR